MTRRTWIESSDPLHDRRIPYRGRVFYSGRWRTRRAVEAHRAAKRRAYALRKVGL